VTRAIEKGMTTVTDDTVVDVKSAGQARLMIQVFGG
jgi:hypothetical protein